MLSCACISQVSAHQLYKHSTIVVHYFALCCAVLSCASTIATLWCTVTTSCCRSQNCLLQITKLLLQSLHITTAHQLAAHVELDFSPRKPPYKAAFIFHQALVTRCKRAFMQALADQHSVSIDGLRLILRKDPQSDRKSDIKAGKTAFLYNRGGLMQDE